MNDDLGDDVLFALAGTVVIMVICYLLSLGAGVPFWN